MRGVHSAHKGGTVPTQWEGVAPHSQAPSSGPFTGGEREAGGQLMLSRVTQAQLEPLRCLWSPLNAALWSGFISHQEKKGLFCSVRCSLQ